MSPTSKSRKRIRRSQLLADRAMSVGEPWWYQDVDDVDDRSWAQKFDDWMLSYLSAPVAAVSCVLAGGIFTLLAIVAVHDVNDLRAYQNAPSCAEEAVTPCRADVPVTIVAVGDTAGKHPTHYVDVYGLSQPITRIELRDGSGAWAAARDVDDGTVELWHSVPVSFTAGDATTKTVDTPDETVAREALFVLPALAGTAMFALYWLRRWRYNRTGAKSWPEWLALLEPTAMIATIGLLIAAVIGSAVEFLVDSVVLTVAVGGGITLVGFALFAMNSWRGRTRTT